MLVRCPSCRTLVIGKQFSSDRERVRFGATRRNAPIPKRISDSDFDEICGSFKISPKKNRDFLRAVVVGAAEGLAEFQAQQRSQPHRRNDRKLVAGAISALKKMERRLDRLGPEGKEALREFEDFLSPLASARWLNQQFQTIASLQR